MFNWIKKTATKADETLDQTKKDIAETADKVQQVLDESGKSVNTVIKVVTIALIVSVVANIINIGSTILHGKSKSTVVIENLYLGDKK